MDENMVIWSAKLRLTSDRTGGGLKEQEPYKECCKYIYQHLADLITRLVIYLVGRGDIGVFARAM